MTWNVTKTDVNYPKKNQFEDMFLGFDNLFDSMGLNRVNSSYPPTDIWIESSGKTYVQLAVAGFKKENINVEVQDNSLKISGIAEKINNSKDKKYHSTGISRKSFERVFILADSADVESAEIVDGMLTVVINSVPVTKNVKKIEVK